MKNRLSVARGKIRKYAEDHEKETGDKMFVSVGIPFLTQLFSKESKALMVPDMSKSIISEAAASGSENASAAEKAGRKGFDIMRKKGLMIAASVAVVAAAAAGIIIGVNSGDKEVKSREKTNVSSAVSASGESGAASGLTSDDESEIRYHHELYLEYGFDYDGLPEISGNIAWAGGCADNYNTFVVTDNSKVYFKNDYDPFEYYCTIDPDFDEIIPTGPIMDESKNVILLTKNKDGSYTFRNEAKGVKSSFSADALELVKYSNGKLYLYSIDRGDVFVSTVDEDGKTTEKNRVSVKRNDSEPTELTDVKALNHSGKSIFGDNILVLDGSGSLFEVIFDAGSSGELLTENTVSLQPMDDIENIIAQEYSDQLFMYLKSGDQNNTIGIYRH